VRDRSRRVLTSTLAAVLSAVLLVSAAEIPSLTGRVVDNANILTAAARERLTAALKAHEDATGNQIAVLTVPTIQPQSIEDYAVKVFEAWKLGQKGNDNGVLIVVVARDRKLRIEVGYGLEPVLTDGAAGEIIRTAMTPWFKRGNYDRGIEDGVRAVIGRLEGKPATSPAAAPPESSRAPSAMSWPERILIGLFIFGMIGMFTLLGIATPGLGWFLYVFLIPFWAIFPRFVVGGAAGTALLAAYLVGFPLAKRRVRHALWYRRAEQSMKDKGFANIGGFTVGGSGGGSSSGGFSSGGFSGGGGSSGGGGASGSW
jgi:uncharacterized protein